MAGTKELAALVNRLEAVTTKLEGISAGVGSGEDVCKLHNVLWACEGMTSGVAYNEEYS